MAEEVRSFGAETLKVLERKDAEGLAALLASNERELSEAMRDIRKIKIKQVETQQAQWALMGIGIDQTIAKIEAFLANPQTPQQVVAQESRTEAKVIGTVIEGVNLTAKVLRAIPEFQAGGAGAFGSPYTTVQVGGQMAAEIAGAVAQSFIAVANIHSDQAALAEAQARIELAKQEATAALAHWQNQKQQVLEQIAEIDLKLEISNAELRRHDSRVENSKQVEQYLRDKYTNRELYGWMLGEVSGLYFQAYKFAFDTAKLAERAFHFEHGESSTQFIQFSYWDSLKKGLYSGERLLLDIRRMEAAHLEADRRALEITRHVSLREDSPAELQELLATGRCQLEVSEALLDGDFPGHYFRRIKTVSVSIPGQLPPLANVNCTLTLLANRLRKDANARGSYPHTEDGDDPRFLTNLVPIQAIATSRPSADPGLFELKFDDDRYLPFEGAGAISSWRVELHQSNNTINLGAIRDVVLSISYTARNAGAPLEAVARTSHDKSLGRGGLRPPPRHNLSLRQDLPNAWKQLSEAKPGQEIEIALPLGIDQLSGRYRGLAVRMERVVAYAHGRPGTGEDVLQLKLDPPKGSGAPLTGWARPWGRSRTSRAKAELGGAPGKWKLTVGAKGGNVAELFDDVVLVFDLRVRT